MAHFTRGWDGFHINDSPPFFIPNVFLYLFLLKNDIKKRFDKQKKSKYSGFCSESNQDIDFLTYLIDKRLFYIIGQKTS